METTTLFTRLRTGALLVLRSLRFLINNPQMFLYGIVALAGTMGSALLPFEVALPFLSSYILIFKHVLAQMINVFCMLALAHHTMHRLREQHTSLRESLYNAGSRWRGLILLGISTALLPLVGGYLYPAFLPHTIIIVVASLILVLLKYPLDLTLAIIATGHESFTQALRRSVQLMWHHVATLSTMIMTLFLVEVVLEIMLNLLTLALYRFILGPMQTPFYALAIGAMATLIKLSLEIATLTLFYYEYYTKQELELAEIYVTRM